MKNLNKNKLPIAMLATALVLAATAAYYSVFGISRLFASQAIAVIIMASILEISKLITASYLEQYWSTIHWVRRVYLTIALLILMAITSLGIYGFLVAAYQDTAYKAQTIDKQVELQQTKKDRFTEQLTGITKEKQALDNNIAQLTKGLSNNILTRTDRNGNVTTTTSAANRQALERQLDQSVKQRDALISKEAALNDSVTAIDLRVLDLQSNSEIAAEIGPLKHVAKVAGRSVDTVVNWFILLFIVVFDPLAIMLLISANKTLQRKINPQPVESQQETQEVEIEVQQSQEQEKQRNQPVQGSKWW